MKFSTFQNQLLNISYYLFCLIPVGLVTGPFLPDLFLTIISSIYLFFFIKIDKVNKFTKYFFYVSIAFYFIIIFSSLLSEVIFVSFKSSFFYLRFIIFIPAVIFIFKNKKISINSLLYLLLLISIIIIFDSYFQYIFKTNIIGLEPTKISDYDYRITGLFGKDEILGSYLSKIFPVIITFVFLSNLKFKELLTIFLFVIFGISIFISSERTSFIHFLIFSFLFLSLSSIKYKKFFFIFFFSIILLIIVNDSGKKQRMILSLQNSFKNLEFSAYHTLHYKTAWKMFLDRRIIGHGPKSFRYKCSSEKYSSGKGSCSTHPHNTYLQLLAETGLLGFLIITILFTLILIKLAKIFFIKYFYKKNIYYNSEISILIGLFIYLWPISPNGNFFNNWLSTFLFFQASIFFLCKEIKSNQTIKNNI